MNVEELERLGINVWSDFGAYNEGGYYVSVEDATNLARRVIAAEELVEAERVSLCVMEGVDGENDCSRGIDAIESSLAAYEATK